MIAHRLGEGPVIHPGLSARIGDNINGPSLIRVPDWIARPLGRYYLYFAHHKGRFLRMAYADTLSGPWTVHEPGVLDVERSLFVTEDLGTVKGTGAWAKATGGRFDYAHVASPDVHVDHGAGVIRLYYHGLCADGEQLTRLAVSSDGLHFEPRAPLLGPPYFRVFAHGASIYAIAWGGAVFRAAHWEGPFQPGPPLLAPLMDGGRAIRHVALHRDGDTLDLFYTRIGDAPESILHARIGLGPGWPEWRIGAPRTVLSPQLGWEGAALPCAPSRIGAAPGPENALRDPCIFAEDGALTLLYCGGGESAIGMAALHGATGRSSPRKD